jgi:hypothetical protein
MFFIKPKESLPCTCMSEKEFIFEAADLQNACFDFYVFYLMECFLVSLCVNT